MKNKSEIPVRVFLATLFAAGTAGCTQLGEGDKVKVVAPHLGGEHMAVSVDGFNGCLVYDGQILTVTGEPEVRMIDRENSVTEVPVETETSSGMPCDGIIPRNVIKPVNP